MDYEVSKLEVPVAADDHVRGPADAPVTLVEYGDFECPYCAEAAPIVRQLEKKYEGKLRVIFRHFPLEMHEHAQDAAETAEYAAARGKFWQMHDLLYANQDALENKDLREYADTLGLDGRALADALRRGEYRGKVLAQKEGGEKSGVPGTPAFFLNGSLFEEDPGTLDDAIDWLLERGEG